MKKWIKGLRDSLYKQYVEKDSWDFIKIVQFEDKSKKKDLVFLSPEQAIQLKKILEKWYPKWYP